MQVQPHIKGRLPLDHAQDAAFCIGFLGYWQQLISDLLGLTAKVRPCFISGCSPASWTPCQYAALQHCHDNVLTMLVFLGDMLDQLSS